MSLHASSETATGRSMMVSNGGLPAAASLSSPTNNRKPAAPKRASMMAKKKKKGPKRDALKEHMQDEMRARNLLLEMMPAGAMCAERRQQAAAEREKQAAAKAAAAARAAEEEALRAAELERQQAARVRELEQQAARARALELEQQAARAKELEQQAAAMARAAQLEQQAKARAQARAALEAELEQQAMLERRATAVIDAELAQRASARAALDAELAERMRARAMLDAELVQRVRARAALDAELQQQAQTSAFLRRQSELGVLSAPSVGGLHASGLGAAGILNHQHAALGNSSLASARFGSALESTSIPLSQGGLPSLGMAPSGFGQAQQVMPTHMPSSALVSSSFNHGPLHGFHQPGLDSAALPTIPTAARAPPSDEEDEEAFFRMVKGRSQKERFPIKLYRMIHEAKKEGREHVVSFLPPHGKAFGIHDEATFVREIMPRYFGDCKLSSLQKQLNLYGFKKITVGKERGKLSYFHSCFRKGKPSMCHNIHRRCTTGAKKGAAQKK